MEQISVERYEIHRSTNSSESSRAANGWGQGKEIIQKNYFSQSLQNTIFIALVSLDQRFLPLGLHICSQSTQVTTVTNTLGQHKLTLPQGETPYLPPTSYSQSLLALP